MASAVCELTWLFHLLQELHIPVPTPILLYCDNTSAIHIAGNPVLHERTKHIELDIHLVRDNLKAGFITPRYLSTHLQPADLFTKPMTATRSSLLLSKLGVLNLFTPSNLREGNKHKYASSVS